MLFIYLQTNDFTMKPTTLLSVKNVFKTIFYTLFVLMSATLLYSCSSDPAVDVPKKTASLVVTPTQVANVAAAGANAMVAITTNQSSWSATSDKDWCRVTAKTDKGFTLVVDANSTTSNRSGTVTVSAGEATPVKISVSQLGVNAQLSVSPTQVTDVIADGGGAKITVSTNQSSWSATSDKDWCKVSGVTEKDFTIVVDANSATEARSATVTVSAGNATAVKISVSQLGAAHALSISPEVYSIEFSAASQSEEFVYSVATNLSSWNVTLTTTEATWCRVSKDAANNRFTITADANSSTSSRGGAVVTVSAGNAAPLKITVNQKAKSTQDSEDYEYGEGEGWD